MRSLDGFYSSSCAAQHVMANDCGVSRSHMKKLRMTADKFSVTKQLISTRSVCFQVIPLTGMFDQ